ncbi:hypothetical protein MTQ13_03050 [Streptomyces sp. XM4011]|uniref:hypothetical protein n=1 Tax=Streptomyces sp. XM4011 TaxID=2929780 RepID=UPI001FF7ABB4|nr:hypothetical protein [Streptomyces sp. XM4011]MCK1813259.1 hypothetical protein [Streptomyces sp. XM4011]
MTASNRCPVCSAECSSCGTPGTGPGVAIRPATSGPVAVYEVQRDGRTVRMKLNAADAARLGATPVGGETDEPQGKVRPAANKARRAPNK